MIPSDPTSAYIRPKIMRSEAEPRWSGDQERIEAAVDVVLWKAVWVASGLPLEAWSGWPGLPHFRQAMEQAAWEAVAAQYVAERRCSWEAAEKAAAEALGLWYWTLDRRRRAWAAKVAGLRNGGTPDVTGDSYQD